jgi:hypothetical protein
LPPSLFPFGASSSFLNFNYLNIFFDRSEK